MQRNLLGNRKKVLIEDNGEKRYITEYRKYAIRNANKSEPFFVDYNKIIDNKKVDFTNSKKNTLSVRDKSIIGCLMFEEMMDKIFDDMIENKNIYHFPNSVKLIIGEIEREFDKYSFFTYDTRDCLNKLIQNSEFHGYTWNIIVSKRLRDKLYYYTNVKKQKYTKCKTLNGKQLLASYRGKLSLLMSRLKKRGLDPLYIKRHLKALLQNI
ncbi:MAG: hypothetical protein ACW980_24975 [Promethearchaeota archaeon]|jgi:hypothetical protein